MEIVLEKKKNRDSKVLPRRARLMEDGFHQQNNKVIPYPNGFNIIHKNQFDQLSQEEKNFMPWTSNAQSAVRVFFCRQNHQDSRSQINQFQKPTAVYFADKETGQRFIDFLQFRGINKEKRIEGLKKIGKRWLYEVFNTFMSDQLFRLHETSNLHNQARQKKLKGLTQCSEIMNFDQSICKNMMNQLLRIAEKRQQIEKDQIKQKKVDKMQSYVGYFKKVEGIQVHKLFSLWLHQAKTLFDQIAQKEEEEQRRIQEEEIQIQEEIDQDIDIPEKLQFQDNEEVEQEIKERKFNDVHLQNFRLILDPTITLIKPIFVIQFKNKESKHGKIIVEHSSEQLFQNLQNQELVLHLQIDHNGWFVDLKVVLEYYGLRDILEFSIYDELRDITDRQVNLAQEQEHQLKTFLVQTNKLMQGSVKCIEIQKNLHNNRRHFAQLNISGDFQAQYYQDQSKNIPVIQFDIYEQDPFNVEQQVDRDCLFVHPHYLNIIGMPLEAHEIKHLQFKQFHYPLTDNTMIWRQFKIDQIEKTLKISGQNWADSKWSNDYLIEAQEYIQEIGQKQQNINIINLFPHYVEESQHTYISRYNDLANYLYQEEQDDVLAQILIKCGLRGFSIENRLQLMPILLKSTQQIQTLAQNYQIKYTLNEVSILQQFLQQADKYLDENIKQQNQQILDQYLQSFQNISAHIFGSQLNKKLNQQRKQILDVYNASYLINNSIQMPLVVNLFRLLDQPSNEEGVFILLQSLQFDTVYPQLDLDLDFSPEMLFTDHLKNLFSDFFYFDVWLRVLDYVITIGFISGGHYPKVLASVIGGIFQSKEFNHRSLQELQAQLKLYGKLQCDPDILINNSYHCFQTSQFYTLQKPEKLTKLIELGVDPIEQIIKDQKKFDPNEEIIEEFYIDVPEEHQDSILREIDIHYDIPTKISHQFVQKLPPKSITLMIHKIHLHSIQYGKPKTTIKYGEQQLNENYDNVIFNKNYSEISIQIEQGEQIFEKRINIHNYQPNIIHKEILILNDNFQMQRNYKQSQIEFSILISNQSEEQYWKQASAMNYPEFKQLLSQYFRIDPSKFDFQGTFKEQSKDQSLYLVDFMVQFIFNSNQEHQVKLLNIYKTLNLFSPVYGDGIYFSSLRQMLNDYYQSKGLLMQDYLSFLPEYEVRFIKVTIIDDQCEILIDLTHEFNQYLTQNLINHNTYNLELIDGNNSISLLKLIFTKTQKQMKDTKSQMLILRLKYISFQQIKKESFHLDKQFNVTMGQIKQANNLQQQFENNAYILKMDNQFLIKFEQFKNIMDQLPLIRQFQQPPQTNNQHLAQIRSRGAVKQMVTCEVVGLIRNKAGEIQYYAIEINKKTQIVYKEAVCFLSKINEEEIEEMQKPWKK